MITFAIYLGISVGACTACFILGVLAGASGRIDAIQEQEREVML